MVEDAPLKVRPVVVVKFQELFIVKTVAPRVSVLVLEFVLAKDPHDIACQFVFSDPLVRV